MKPAKYNKLPALYECCSKDGLRDNLACIHIFNGFATVTDACVLIRYDLYDHFMPDQLRLLHNKLIPGHFWRIMRDNPPYCTIVKDDCIQVLKGEYSMVFEFKRTENLKYPNIHAVLNDVINGSLSEQKDHMSIDPKKIEIVTKVIGNKSLTFLFNANNRGYCVYNPENDNAVAVIMPVQTDLPHPSFKKFETIEMPLDNG